MAIIPLNFGGGGGTGSDDVTASKNQVLKGYTAVTTDSNDEPKEGSIESKAAQTYYATTSDQSIASGKYLSGNQTIKAISQSNLSAGNIKKGTTISVANGNGNVWSVAGTYSTPSSGQSAVTAGAMLSGYSGFVNGGGEVKGSITSQAAKTVYATTADQTVVSSGKYCSGNITLKKLTQTNLAAANILRGKTISINNGSTNVWSVAGNNAALRCVSGSAKTGSTRITVDGKSLYYVDINPSITPVQIVSYAGANYANMRIDNVMHGTELEEINVSSLPKTSSQVRLVTVNSQTTVYYYIFGY